VDAVVEDSVERSGNHVHIDAQLIQGASDRHVWAKSYDRNLRDVVTLQEEIAHAIAQEIQAKLSPEEQARLASAHPVDPEAYEAYLRGRFEWNKRTLEGLEKSVRYFEQAIGKDPTYALAYAGLADSYSILGDNGFAPPAEAYARAMAAALKALELNGNLAEGHEALAGVMNNYDWDWSGAEREFQRAIALNPSYATAHQWYAGHLAAMGRYTEAIAQIRLAHELDPLSPRIDANVAMMLYYARQYDRALEQARQLVELDPEYPGTYCMLGNVLLQKKAYDEAIQAYRRCMQYFGPDFSPRPC
jgi:tetratricopeptide (TPR) repeat protein